MIVISNTEIYSQELLILLEKYRKVSIKIIKKFLSINNTI